MPSEIREKPPPTPHPDQPRKPGSRRESGPTPRKDPEPLEEYDSDSGMYDSCVDDLNLMLSQPISEPDPALASASRDTPLPAFLQIQKDQPGTSEVFEAVRSRSGDTKVPRAGWASRLISRFTRGSTSRRPPRASTTSTLARSHSAGEGLRIDSGSDADDDESSADLPRGMWLSLLLLSYASAVTLGLGWMLWTGRGLQHSEPPAADSPHIGDERASKATETSAREVLPPIPAENLVVLAETIRIGDVEITPLGVTLSPVELVRSIDPADYRHEDSNSLVVRFKLTNLSKEHAFAPLARDLLRDQAAPRDRSFVAEPDGGKIGLFPLAVESEWLILGQEFPILKPGENAETLVASAIVKEDRLPNELTWHIRLRTGPYRTDILGIRFTRSELSR